SDSLTRWIQPRRRLKAQTTSAISQPQLRRYAQMMRACERPFSSLAHTAGPGTTSHWLSGCPGKPRDSGSPTGQMLDQLRLVQAHHSSAAAAANGALLAVEQRSDSIPTVRWRILAPQREIWESMETAVCGSTTWWTHVSGHTGH